MRPPLAIAVGEQFGRLTVLARVENSPHDRSRQYLVVCDCGRERVVRSWKLKGGSTTSCGRHGPPPPVRTGSPGYPCGADGHAAKQSPTYITWKAMRQRCRDPHHARYRLYGGRGITVCQRWVTIREGFLNFLADMGERPEGMTLDRIDPDGNYEPTNCRWATDAQQRANRRPRAQT